MDLSLTHVITVSLSASTPGLSNFNTSNLAIFTDEAPSPSYPTGTPFGIYYSSRQVGMDYGTGSKTYAQAVAIFSQRRNILSGGGYLVVVPMITSGTPETITAAITRAQSLVQFFGVLCNVTGRSAAEWTAASNYVQSQNMILGRATYAAADLAVTTGWYWQIMTAGNSHTRGMYYGNAGTQLDADVALAAAFSRNMSVDFSGSNTAMTAQMKTLDTIQSDGSLTEALYTTCGVAGVLAYPSLQGVPALQDFNSNGGFFDEIYNAGWFQGAIQVAGFNAAKQTGTKIPQTDDGVDVFLGAYRRVCVQGVTNAYLAPGAWTSPDTFGRKDDFLRNVAEQGFFLYALPVAQQLPADRVARRMPLAQIAGKEAGAIHNSNVLVNINA